MKVKYDEENELFLVNGEEIFWSSLYILRQDEISQEKLRKRLEVSEDEENILEEEINDLEEMGMIEKKDGKIITKGPGKEAYEKAKEKTSFRGYKQKAIDDIDRVRSEAEGVLMSGENIYCTSCGKKYDSSKLECPHCSKVNPNQEFHWLDLFENCFFGSEVVTIFLLLVFYLWYQDIAFLSALITSPFWIAGTLIIVISVLYLLHELGREVIKKYKS